MYICSAAVGVTLKDSGFPENDFEVVRGNLEVRWERIAPYPLTLIQYLIFFNCQYYPSICSLCYYKSYMNQRNYYGKFKTYEFCYA